MAHVLPYYLTLSLGTGFRFAATSSMAALLDLIIYPSATFQYEADMFTSLRVTLAVIF